MNNQCKNVTTETLTNTVTVAGQRFVWCSLLLLGCSALMKSQMVLRCSK